MMKQYDILLIDDEVRRMRATLDMLRSDNYKVEQIARVQEAYDLLKDHPDICEIIILDIMMPADGEFDVPDADLGLRTGFLLLEKLREIPNFKIPIIVLTANAAYEEELNGKVDHFFVKPVAYSQLKQKIEELRGNI